MGDRLSRCEALFIDVGNTLIRARTGVGGEYAQAARAFGLRPDPAQLEVRFAHAFAKHRDAARLAGRLAYGRTQAEATNFWRAVVGDVFRDDDITSDACDQLFTRLYEHFTQAQAWLVFDDTLPLLREAKARGVPVVVVSNWDARLPALLDTLELTGHCHAVVGSFAVGAEKPSPEIFAHARAALPRVIPPERILHVGDSWREDIEGALAAGLQAIHLDRSGGLPRADNRIRSLRELFVADEQP
jgi:putative hydrolase of the HAD superfamily